LIRKQKIPWSEVLKTLPHKTKKVKGRNVTYIDQPFKPTKNPWLFTKERLCLDEILKGHLDIQTSFREKWLTMSAETQHDSYKEICRDLATSFNKLKTTIGNINIAIGRRKTSFEYLFKKIQRSQLKKIQSVVNRVQFTLKLDNTLWEEVDINMFDPELYVKRIPQEWKNSDTAVKAVAEIRLFFSENDFSFTKEKEEDESSEDDSKENH